MALPPLVILAIGIITVIGMIIALRINAFIALITAAIVVSLLSPEVLEPTGKNATAENMAEYQTKLKEIDEKGSQKISRVAVAFGNTAGKIGIVIALAAVIGTCMMDSGAADRIVRAFLSLLGEKRASFALMGSGFVLSIPVFFDTVFYLLVPLARSLHRKTNKNYLMYLLAIAAGGAITHTLVPPTPGPLVMADQLGVPIGTMIFVGAIVALPAALAGIVFAVVADKLMPIPMRQTGSEPDPEPLEDSELPPLFMSLLPVLLPVLMISTHTVVGTLAKGNSDGLAASLIHYTAIIGNANLALLVSTAVAMYMLIKQRKIGLEKMSRVVETSLMSGGTIILITAGGGAFGGMLKAANIGPAIEAMFAGSGDTASGMIFLFLGFGVASLLKVAQGSGTVAMITASSMLSAMLVDPSTLGFNPVYLATAIGAGSLMGSWMNDSGFWIFTKMGGLTEVESLKSWTPLLCVLGIVSMIMTLILATVMPMTGA